MFPVIYVEDNRIFIDDIDLTDGNTGLYAASLKVKSEWSYQQEYKQRLLDQLISWIFHITRKSYKGQLRDT